MSRSTRYLLSMIDALLIMLWLPAGAYAAALVNEQGKSPLNIDPVVAVFCVVLATLAGATTLAARVNKLLTDDPEKPLVRPWLFCMAHMLGSWSAGTAAFLMSQHQKFDVWLALLIVFILSFLGAKGIEMVVEKYLPIARLKG